MNYWRDSLNSNEPLDVIELLTKCYHNILIPISFYALDEGFKGSSYSTLQRHLLTPTLDLRTTRIRPFYKAQSIQYCGA